MLALRGVWVSFIISIITYLINYICSILFVGEWVLMNNDVVSLMCLRTPTIAIVDVCVESGKHWLRFEQGSMRSNAQITQSPRLLGPCRINSFHTTYASMLTTLAIADAMALAQRLGT